MRTSPRNTSAFDLSHLQHASLRAWCGRLPCATAIHILRLMLPPFACFRSERNRFVELARKMVARFSNALLAKTYLAWAAHTRREAEVREKTTRRAMALMSGRAELLLQVFFHAWLEQVLFPQPPGTLPRPLCARALRGRVL